MKRVNGDWVLTRSSLPLIDEETKALIQQTEFRSAVTLRRLELRTSNG